MKLNATTFALATTIAVAILWTVCSLIVVLVPGMSMNMSGYMMHADFTEMQWNMTFTGFLFGLVLWSLSAGLLAWIIALVYNKLS